MNFSPKISLSRLKIILVVVLLFFLFKEMTVSVCEAFSNVPGYDRCVSPDKSYSFLFFILAALPLAFLPRKDNAISIMLWSLYFMHVFGAIYLLPRIAIGVGVEAKVIFGILILLSFFVLSIFSRIKFPRLRRIDVDGRQFIIFLLVINFLVAGLIINAFGLNFNLPSIFDVYGAREDFKDALEAQGSRFIGYVIIIGGYSLAPISLVIGLFFLRRYLFLASILLFSSVLISVVVYSAAAFKSVAMIPLISGFLYLLLRNAKNLLFRFFVFWAFVFCIGFLTNLLELDGTIFLHWIRRVFFTPGMNVIFYFDHYGFFSSGNGNVAPSVIMDVYYDSVGSANAGIYGNGLAVGGVWGILGNIAIISLYILMLKSIAIPRQHGIVIAATFPFVYALSNSATTTALVTYGGVVTLVLLYLGAASIDQLDCNNANKGRAPE